jgi:hypothetical protein
MATDIKPGAVLFTGDHKRLQENARKKMQEKGQAWHFAILQKVVQLL